MTTKSHIYFILFVFWTSLLVWWASGSPLAAWAITLAAVITLEILLWRWSRKRQKTLVAYWDMKDNTAPIGVVEEVMTLNKARVRLSPSEQRADWPMLQPFEDENWTDFNFRQVSAEAEFLMQRISEALASASVKFSSMTRVISIATAQQVLVNYHAAYDWRADEDADQNVILIPISARTKAWAETLDQE